MEKVRVKVDSAGKIPWVDLAGNFVGKVFQVNKLAGRAGKAIDLLGWVGTTVGLVKASSVDNPDSPKGPRYRRALDGSQLVGNRLAEGMMPVQMASASLACHQSTGVLKL